MGIFHLLFISFWGTFSLGRLSDPPSHMLQGHSPDQNVYRKKKNLGTYKEVSLPVPSFLVPTSNQAQQTKEGIKWSLGPGISRIERHQKNRWILLFLQQADAAAAAVAVAAATSWEKTDLSVIPEPLLSVHLGLGQRSPWGRAEVPFSRREKGNLLTSQTKYWYSLLICSFWQF
jgi:hypothetical protein